MRVYVCKETIHIRNMRLSSITHTHIYIDGYQSFRVAPLRTRTQGRSQEKKKRRNMPMLSVSITVHLNGPIIIIIISTGSSVKWKRRMSSTKKKKTEGRNAFSSPLSACSLLESPHFNYMSPTTIYVQLLIVHVDVSGLLPQQVIQARDGPPVRRHDPAPPQYIRQLLTHHLQCLWQQIHVQHVGRRQ